MPDYVLKNDETGGEYVLSLPNGAGDAQKAEALAPLEAAGWHLDEGSAAGDVPPPIQQPPGVTPESAQADDAQPSGAHADDAAPLSLDDDQNPDPAQEFVQPEPTKEIS